MRQEAPDRRPCPRAKAVTPSGALGGLRLWEVAGTQCKSLFVASASSETFIYPLHTHRHAHQAENDPAQPSLGRWIN